MEKLKVNAEIFNDDELEQASRALYNAFINDAELYDEMKSLGITNEEIYDNIGLFTDLKVDRDKEKLVKTFEDCKKYDCFYHTSVARTNYGFEKVYDAVGPYKEHLKYLSHFVMKDFNDDYNKVTVKSLDNQTAVKLIKTEIKSRNWVYLTGAIRSGRSYIAIALANAYASKDTNKVAFIDAVKRFGELGRLYFSDRNDFEELMNELKDVNFLVIDNFGSEVKNSIIRDAILLPLLEYRANKKLLTLFTSNHDIKRIVKMYELKKDAGASIEADTLNSILRTMIRSELNVGNTAKY